MTLVDIPIAGVTSIDQGQRSIVARHRRYWDLKKEVPLSLMVFNSRSPSSRFFPQPLPLPSDHLRAWAKIPSDPNPGPKSGKQPDGNSYSNAAQYIDIIDNASWWIAYHEEL